MAESTYLQSLPLGKGKLVCLARYFRQLAQIYVLWFLQIMELSSRRSTGDDHPADLGPKHLKRAKVDALIKKISLAEGTGHAETSLKL